VSEILLTFAVGSTVKSCILSTR